MRVAYYARHSSDSSDLQNQRSTRDQLAALRQAAAARGWLEISGYFDEGISGSTIGNRPGLQALLRDAELGAFDAVITEALDRISRDQEGTAHIYKRLSYHGVALETLSEGRISELHVGLTATMNQLFLTELGKKTRRGLIARVEAGFSGGGLCYAYRIIEKGVFAIAAAPAVVVRRIFRDYANGGSARTIAAALNAEGTPGPRGGEWAACTIAGDRRTASCTRNCISECASSIGDAIANTPTRVVAVRCSTRQASGSANLYLSSASSTTSSGNVRKRATGP